MERARLVAKHSSRGDGEGSMSGSSSSSGQLSLSVILPRVGFDETYVKHFFEQLGTLEDLVFVELPCTGFANDILVVALYSADSKGHIKVARSCKQIPIGSTLLEVLPTKHAYHSKGSSRKDSTDKLPFSFIFDTKTLEELFKSFGKITDWNLAQSDGEVLPQGMVFFDNASAVKPVVETLNGKVLADITMYVAPERIPNLKPSAKIPLKFSFSKRNLLQSPMLQNLIHESRKSDGNPHTNLYVKNFPENFTEEDLRSLFESFGRITSIVKYRSPQVGKDYGFVNFATHSSAQSALESLHGKKIGGMRLYVAQAMKKEDRIRHLSELFGKKAPNVSASVSNYMNSTATSDLIPQGRFSVLVKNLPYGTTDEQVRKLFRVYGTITGVCLNSVKDSQNPEASAVVSFGDKSHSKNAAKYGNSTQYEGRTIYISEIETESEFSTAERREDILEGTKGNISINSLRKENVCNSHGPENTSESDSWQATEPDSPTSALKRKIEEEFQCGRMETRKEKLSETPQDLLVMVSRITGMTKALQIVDELTRSYDQDQLHEMCRDSTYLMSAIERLS